MTDFKYTLDPSSKKFVCPDCEKKRFVRYINVKTKEYAPEEFGRCDREQNCGHLNVPTRQNNWYLIDFLELTKISDKAYKAVDKNAVVHFLPISQIKDINESRCWLPKWLITEKKIPFSSAESKSIDSGTSYTRPTKKPKPEVSFHSMELLGEMFNTDSLADNFTGFLYSIFDADEVVKVKSKYRITGTNNPWDKATIFWQIDKNENIRCGKVMQYDVTTGKRIKKPYSRINWLHSVMKIENYNLDQCLFGLHLTNTDGNNTIAIVESEKTAIIMSITAPEYTWLATGGLSNLKLEKLDPISTRQIVLYPDKGAYDQWDKIAEEAKKKHFKIQTSDLLERANIEDGTDIADLYLSRYLNNEIENKPKDQAEKNTNNDEKQIRINQSRTENLRERIAKASRDIETITREIKKVEGTIAWDKNRSRQARTICERGF